MRAWIVSILLGAMLFGGLPASAALTEGQITSILNLLQSFGAEQQVIRDVEVALRGDSPNCTFTETLYRGVTDETTYGQVTRVQRFLYVDPTTGYYGPITESAVQMFQAAQGIVSSGTPETTGFGVVGPKTSAVLIEVCTARAQQTQGTSTGTNSTSQSGSMSSNSSTTITTTGNSTTIPTTPPTGFISDTDYLNTLRQEVYDIGVQNGVSSQDLADIDTALSQLPEGPTTNDDASLPIAPILSTALSGVLNSLLQSLFSNPASAAASAALRDFGTPRVIAVVPCPCSGNVLIKMQPTGPYYPVALTYTPGTQAFLSYNIPTVGQSLLGKYTPVGVCMVPSGPSCVPVPNNGNITSLTGSSLQ